jgi:hypothetical protein
VLRNRCSTKSGVSTLLSKRQRQPENLPWADQVMVNRTAHSCVGVFGVWRAPWIITSPKTMSIAQA